MSSDVTVTAIIIIMNKIHEEDIHNVDDYNDDDAENGNFIVW